MAKTKQWEPTADGQAVLYGVPGPSYDPGKWSKGRTILFEEARNRIALLYDGNCNVSEHRVSQSASWPIRKFPEEKRGTWRMDGDEVVLEFDGKEVARGVEVAGMVHDPSKGNALDMAATMRGEGAAA